MGPRGAAQLASRAAGSWALSLKGTASRAQAHLPGKELTVLSGIRASLLAPSVTASGPIRVLSIGPHAHTRRHYQGRGPERQLSVPRRQHPGSPTPFAPAPHTHPCCTRSFGFSPVSPFPWFSRRPLNHCVNPRLLSLLQRRGSPAQAKLVCPGRAPPPEASVSSGLPPPPLPLNLLCSVCLGPARPTRQAASLPPRPHRVCGGERRHLLDGQRLHTREAG